MSFSQFQNTFSEVQPSIINVKGVKLTGDVIADPILRNKLGATKANAARIFKAHGLKAVVLVAVGIDAWDVFTAENWQRELVRKCYGWEGAFIGGTTGAVIAGAGGQMGPQIAAPEEAITVPVFSFIGGVIGYNLGCTVHDVVSDWIVSEGYTP